MNDDILLNKFQKKAIKQQLSEFDILGMYAFSDFSRELLYCIVFKYKEIIFTKEVFFTASCRDITQPDISNFIERTKEELEDSIDTIEKLIFCKKDSYLEDIAGKANLICSYVFSQFWNYAPLLELDYDKFRKRHELNPFCEELLSNGDTPAIAFSKMITFHGIDIDKALELLPAKK